MKKKTFTLKSGSGLDNFFSISGRYFAMRGNKTGHISSLNDAETQERGFRELKKQQQISRWSMPLDPTRSLRPRLSPSSGNRSD